VSVCAERGWSHDPISFIRHRCEFIFSRKSFDSLSIFRRAQSDPHFAERGYRLLARPSLPAPAYYPLHTYPSNHASAITNCRLSVRRPLLYNSPIMYTLVSYARNSFRQSPCDHLRDSELYYILIYLSLIPVVCTMSARDRVGVFPSVMNYLPFPVAVSI